MIAWFTVSALLSSSPLALADCVNVPIDVPKLFRESHLVFTGRLVDAGEQYRLRFRVDRAWKGRPARGIVVHVLGQPFIGSYAFRERERYLIFANALSAVDRRSAGVGLGAPTAFGIHRSCAGRAPFPLELTKELDKIARSEKPGS